MNITFLFGAGASKEALPITKEIPERLNEIIKRVESNELMLSNDDYFKNNNQYPKRRIQGFLIEDMKWLLEQSSRHASIDTFAKKLYLTRKNEELLRLKNAFSCYLILEQAKPKTDSRYDVFYASILKTTSFSFPKNINVVSWNYDFQFEKAYSEYSNSDELYHNQSSLNVITEFYEFTPDIGGFCILKLNSTTNIWQQHNSSHVQYIKDVPVGLDINLIDQVVESYSFVKFNPQGYRSTLSFAWEGQSFNNRDLLSIAKKAIEKSNVLVIVGYSFPYFNREIDKDIINAMPNLKKVYYQSPDSIKLIDKLIALRDDLRNKIDPIIETEQFYIPNEFD